jgi:hypothetical protein
VLLQWQIVNIRPTQNAQSISYKSSLHTFNLVYTHVIEWAPYIAGVLLLRRNQRLVERVYGSLKSSDSLLRNPSIHLFVHNDPKIVYRYYYSVLNFLPVRQVSEIILNESWQSTENALIE